MKKFVTLFVQGILLGFSLISGMGGGTVAVLLGIYDDLIIAIADFPKHPVKNLKILLPWALGMIVGIVALILPLRFFLEKYPLPTATFIVGLTIGGFKELTKITTGHLNTKNIIIAIVGVVIAASIGVISYYSNAAIDLSSLDALKVVLLLAVGFLASAALVAPGISGTQFLLAVGFLNALLGTISGLFDGANVGNSLLVLGIFLVSIIIGFFVISVFMKWVLGKWRVPTYFAILGFIVGSIFAVYFNGEMKTAYPSAFNIWLLVASIICLLTGFFISYFALKFATKKEEAKEKILTEESNQNDMGN